MSDIADRIRDDIRTGDLTVDQRLTEAFLASRYGVSRTPIREALREVEKAGLVEKTASGVFVKQRSIEDILEIFDIRIALEGLAASRAAEHRNELDLARLESTHERMQEGVEDTDTRSELSRRFHEHLWTASHNAALVEVLSTLYDRMGKFPGTALSQPGRWDEAVAEHQAVLDAVRRRKPDQAKRLAEEHISHARTVRLKMSSAH